MRSPPFWLFVLPCAGWTQCGYFTNVNIPTTDKVAPAVHVMVYDTNLNIIDSSFFDDLPLEVHLPGPGVTVFPIISATDDGGVQELEVSVQISWVCCDGNDLCSTASTGGSWNELQAPATWVSNGIWLDDVATAGCSANTRYLQGYARTYTGTGVDFAGNSRERYLGGVFYP
jgi:hypothetical protein